ncbi:MAG: hypothetical protein AAGA11_12835 [Pseudomonadota bacterium]
MKRLCFGLLLGFVVGMWFGINIGKDRTFYSNPLEDNTLSPGGEVSTN